MNNPKMESYISAQEIQQTFALELFNSGQLLSKDSRTGMHRRQCYYLCTAWLVAHLQWHLCYNGGQQTERLSSPSLFIQRW